MFLLDTNVVSELRRARPHGGVLAFVRGVPADQLKLSAVTLGELQLGVEMTRKQNPAKAREIEAWIDSVPAAFDVLPMDAAAFRAYARLMHEHPGADAEDVMIAATAQIHDLTVATRNVRDFRRLRVPFLNPFETPVA